MKNTRHTEAALAAKAIKSELQSKFPDIKFSVKSDTFSMGDSVHISYTDGVAENVIDAVTSKYQYGHFNGMEDLYENSNMRDGIPQVKYVSVNRSMSDNAKNQIICLLKKQYGEDFNEDTRYGDDYGSWLVRRAFVKWSDQIDQPTEVKTNTIKTESFSIVDYSEKAVAVFGDTKKIKDQLKSIGGRFNPFLSFNGGKAAGWVLPKTKRIELESLVQNEPKTEAKAEISFNPSISFRNKAEAIRCQADKINTSVNGNWTHRRQNFADAAAKKQENMLKVATVLDKLADLWDKGAITNNLKNIKTKSDIEYLLFEYFPPVPSVRGGWYEEKYPSLLKKVNGMGIFSETHFKEVKNELLNLSTRETSEEEKKENELKDLIKDLRGKNIPGFFPTPEAVILQMMDALNIQGYVIKNVLEPSAGIGSICDMIKPYCERIECCEINYSLANILMKKGYDVVSNDVYDIAGRNGYYDMIIMNPPFENREDLKQLMFCYNLLRDGGKLCSVVSSGSISASNGVSAEFRDWISDKNHEILDVPEKSFAGSFNSTNVNVKLVHIKKDN